MCRGTSTQRSLRLRASLPGFLTLVKSSVTVISVEYYAVITTIKTVTMYANLKNTSMQKSTYSTLVIRYTYEDDVGKGCEANPAGAVLCLAPPD